MSRALLLFALLLGPALAWAAPNRIGLLIDRGGNPSVSLAHQVAEDLLQRGGQAYDKLYAGARTWNLDRAQTLKADSTWFRENYAAIVIPCLEGASGTVLPSWGTNFVNGAGTAGIQHSPLSGRWTIPTYVLFVNDYGAGSGGTDETTNAWVPGVRTSGATFRNIPAVTSRGTWGNKLICRLRGNDRDTLYTTTLKAAQVYLSWPGNGSVAVLAGADTTALAWGFSQATDSIAVIWRFRPLAGQPGITYSILPILSLSSIDGALACLQMAYAQTDAEPVRKIQIPIVIHNDYAGGPLNATAKVHVRAVHDTLLANGIPWASQLIQTSSTDYAGVHDADTRAELRRVLADARARVTWAPGSNATGHGLAFFTVAETTEARKAFNADMNTAAKSDSFALPKSRMSIARLVTAAGQVGAWQSKVLLDAGVNVIESTLQTPSASGWALLAPSGGFGLPTPFVAPGDTRQLYVAGTVGLTDGATFSGLTGGGSEHDYVGANVTQRISWAAQTYSSLYWHMNSNVTGTDGYMRWFASVIARHFKFYNRVIAASTGGGAVYQLEKGP